MTASTTSWRHCVDALPISLWALLLLCFLCLWPIIPQSISSPSNPLPPISPTLCLTSGEIQRRLCNPADRAAVSAARHEGCTESMNPNTSSILISCPVRCLTNLTSASNLCHDLTYHERRQHLSGLHSLSHYFP